MKENATKMSQTEKLGLFPYRSFSSGQTEQRQIQPSFEQDLKREGAWRVSPEAWLPLVTFKTQTLHCTPCFQGLRYPVKTQLMVSLCILPPLAVSQKKQIIIHGK